MLTLFTFSTDNWGRPESEVAELMRTFEDFFRVDAPALAARGVRMTVIGRRDRLPVSLREAIEKIEAASAAGEQLHVRLAIDYSGREAILHAARRFQQTSDDSAESFARLLAEAEHAGEPAPDIDLLIRTGGEQRLSNCPLWEIAYAELYFTPCLWPDFGPATPVFPTNTMFSALATNSSSAKARICLRLTPGWRAKGKVSNDQRSGRLARRMRHSRAPSCRACHCARTRRVTSSGVGDVFLFSGA